MTPEFPALQEALIRAARRRIRRRRRLQAAVPALVAAAAAAVVFVSLPHTPDRERPAAPPKDELERAFAAFRRPRTPADAMPPVADYPHLDRARARLVAQAGGTRMFVVPERTPHSLCVFLVGRTTNGDCTQQHAAVTEAKPLAIYLVGFEAMFMPDGTREVILTDADGRSRPLALHDNAALVATRPFAAAVGWTGASGRRHILRRKLTKPLGPTPQGCPQLQPLPANAVAVARDAALLAVDRLYPAIGEAWVTSAARAAGTPCSAAITRRTIVVNLHLLTVDPARRSSASLSQGRLLLGVVGGRMVVYALLH